MTGSGMLFQNDTAKKSTKQKSSIKINHSNWLGRQDLNREIPFSKIPFETTREIGAV